jgi:hypothetical protein
MVVDFCLLLASDSPRARSLDLPHAPAQDLLQQVQLSQMLAQVPATWPTQQPPDGLAEQVSDLRPKAWMLVGRIGGHMGFHLGNRVEVVIAQSPEPALDGGVNGVGIGKDVGSRDQAAYLIGLLQGNPGTDSGQGQSAPTSPALIRDHLGDTPDGCMNSPVPRAHQMPECEAEQIGLGKDTGRPFRLGEIVSARMKKQMDSIELRLYQGDSMHRYSAFLKNINVIGVSRARWRERMQSRASLRNSALSGTDMQQEWRIYVFLTGYGPRGIFLLRQKHYQMAGLHLPVDVTFIDVYARHTVTLSLPSPPRLGSPVCSIH